LGESPKDKVHPCDESMTSLFSSLLTFMKSTYFRTRQGIKSGSGRFYLSDNRHATVVKQPAHRPFAFSRKPFRPWSKALSPLVKNLFD
ncbi:hypothetical protein PN586_16265, partial [Parabacteroides merdae]|uniref:hypothetical protein n=1 Tax=Parabacteroides merdae TaxID=46503 RepID=UPI001E339FC7